MLDAYEHLETEFYLGAAQIDADAQASIHRAHVTLLQQSDQAAGMTIHLLKIASVKAWRSVAPASKSDSSPLFCSVAEARRAAIAYETRRRRLFSALRILQEAASD
jgi:hypothetical protein